jgi:hypothetical protein
MGSFKSVPPAVLASCLTVSERARARDALAHMRVAVNENDDEESLQKCDENVDQVCFHPPGSGYITRTPMLRTAAGHCPPA